ncbi:nucleotidyl transferase AbiEii/AbiGii toxin family protein [Flavitalea sp.]|nr:nucleotidyl transferase AbiEii/AbiGii toxin family protein [Flavitalea sp.]
MRLHEDKELFWEAVQAASHQLNIPEIYIEKDYWVTVALFRIFSSAAGKFAIFKGGTALSKCYKLIERFSEDIDIVVVKEEGEAGNKLKNKLKAITEAVAEIMPEVQLDGITNKLGMIRKTAHQYERMDLKGTYGQIRENIIIEATWLGTFEPHINSTVTSYITEMMAATGEEDIIKDYNMQPFGVLVLSKERTFCEKIMSLVRFSLTADPYTDLANKIRHIYDLHMMLKNTEVKTFFDSPDFETMLNKVGADDVLSFRNNKDWLTTHPAEALVFKVPEETWEKIRQPYQTTFKDLVIGTLPER